MDYLLDLEAALRTHSSEDDVDAEGGGRRFAAMRDTVKYADAFAAIRSFDPESSDKDINAIVCKGFSRNSVDKINKGLSMSIMSFMRRVRHGVVKRGTKKPDKPVRKTSSALAARSTTSL